MLKIGSIGAGGRGGICKLAHRPEEGVELTTICDSSLVVAEDYRKTIRPNIAFYTNYREMLEKAELDAVFITTPDFLHEEMAVTALERRIAVFLEKPMAITIEGCDRILSTADKYKTKLYVGHNMRFFPVIRKMKEIIDSGRIGEVQAIWCRHFVAYGGDAYFKDWHSEQKNTTGLLLQKGAHDIDVIHFLAGAYTIRTVGMGKLSVYNRVTDRRAKGEPWEDFNIRCHNGNWPPLSQKKLSSVIDVEDHTMMLMQLANGVQASYEQCHYTPDAYRNYTIIGTLGRIENYGDFSTADQEAVIRIWDRRVGHLANGTESISIAPFSGSHGGADPLMVQDFINYLKTDERQGAIPMDARAAVAAGYLATQSLRNGNQPYDIPIPRE